MKIRYAMAVFAAATGILLAAGGGAALLDASNEPPSQAVVASPATTGMATYPYAYGAHCATPSHQEMCIPSGTVDIAVLFQRASR